MPLPYVFPFSLPEGDAQTFGIDHATAALDRLAEYLRDKPNVEAFVRACCVPIQDVESAFQQLALERTVDNAVGQQLDNLGDLVGQPRFGVDDETFRKRIKARRKLNRSSGTTDEILEVFQLLYPTAELTFLPQYPASFALVLFDETFSEDEATFAAGILREAKAAGVRAVLEWTATPAEDRFTFDGAAGQGFDDGLFSGGTL